MLAIPVEAYCPKCNWRFRCPFDWSWMFIGARRVVITVIEADGIKRIGPFKCVSKYLKKDILVNKNRSNMKLNLDAIQVRVEVVIKSTFLKKLKARKMLWRHPA